MISSPKQILHYIYSNGIDNLFSGYFALVMATGIVSTAAYLQGMLRIASALLYFNVAAYIVLWMLLILRLIFFGKKVADELTNHIKGSGFLTIVAGTGVLGRQFFIQLHNIPVTVFLCILAAVLYFVIIYTFFAGLTIKSEKPVLRDGISGTWLLATVATQSVALIGSDVASVLEIETIKEVLYFASLVFFLIGCMLYIMVIILIFYRFSFFTLEAEALTGPYWINMGAVAITTLAGSALIMAGSQHALINELHIFLKGFTLFFWSIGTWWIPLLLIFGYWRHVTKKVPLPFTAEGYHPSYWGLVFPLGMYTACTWNLAKALDTPYLLVIPRYFIYVAFVGWAAVFTGLVWSLTKEMILCKSGQV